MIRNTFIDRLLIVVVSCGACTGHSRGTSSTLKELPAALAAGYDISEPWISYYDYSQCNGAGDLNGNGARDLLLSRFTLRASCAVGVADGSQPDEITIVQAREGAAFGHSVLGLMGRGGDGGSLLIVGDPASTLGDSGGWVGAFPASRVNGEPAWEVRGSTFWGSLGQAIASCDDLDGDGVADVAIGEPGRGWDDNVGKVLIVSGHTGRVIQTIRVGKPSEQFGFALCNIGDITGDGVAELLVGAPDYESHGGSVYCVQPRDGEVVYRVRRSADAVQGQLGWGIYRLGHIDGDAADDFAVECAMSDWKTDVGHRRSEFLVVSGRNGSVLTTVRDSSAGVLGQGMSFAGDRNGDGIGDVMHLRSRPDDGTYIELVSGVDGMRLVRVRLAWLDPSVVYRLTGVGDVDCDGIGDVAIGNIQDATSVGGFRIDVVRGRDLMGAFPR